MSEPTHHAPPSSGSHGGKGLSIPGIGKLPTWFVLGGVGLVLVLILRNRSSSGTAAAAGTSTDPAGNVGVIDPATGYVYGSPEDSAGLAASAGSQTPSTGGAGSGSVGDQVTNGPPFTSNAAWSQYAVSVLEQSGYDPGTLSAELGLYLAGQGVTSSQQTDINAAIAVAGLPPVAGAGGKPPAMNVVGSTAGGGTGSTGGGSSSGSPGGGPITAEPVDLHVTHAYTGAGQVAWLSPTIPANQGPLTGFTVIAYDPAGHVANGPFTVGKGQLYANIGGLKRKTSYQVHVWCDPARKGGPHASTTLTTK
jgi:hypothetical protein